MIKRGPKPISIINLKWRPNLAYAVGLIASDGYLSKDGLLVDLTSADKEQLENYLKCLGIKRKIGTKFSNNKKYFRVQIKNRLFYDFLLSIGLTPKKSLTIRGLKIPKIYFSDFLRGYFDGDGCSYDYWDPRWKSSFMFYIDFISASKEFIFWLRNSIRSQLNISGHITFSRKKNVYYQLKYSKKEAIKISGYMYKNNSFIYLKRKKLKIDKSLSIIDGVFAH